MRQEIIIVNLGDINERRGSWKARFVMLPNVVIADVLHFHTMEEIMMADFVIVENTKTGKYRFLKNRHDGDIATMIDANHDSFRVISGSDHKKILNHQLMEILKSIYGDDWEAELDRINQDEQKYGLG